MKHLTRPKLLAIDADSIIHIVANRHWSAGNRDKEGPVKNNTRSFLNSIIKGSGAEKYLVLFQDSGHKNFRKDILPEYKGHRPSSDAVSTWKPVIIEEMKTFNHLALKQIETDDACSILGWKYLDNLVIATADKDLNQIPGWKYNPFKQDKDIGDDDRFHYVTEEEALFFLWCQVLSSDGTDCPLTLTGIDKVGPKTAQKYLKGLKPELYLPQVSMKYTEKYGISDGLRRMAVTYDMMKMLDKPSDNYPESIDVPNAVFKEPERAAAIFDAPKKSGLF